MGYESRIFITERKKSSYAGVWGEIIADFKMSVMGGGFTNLFTRKIDYTLYVDSDEKATDQDKYGATMKYADVGVVVAFLEKEIESGNDYRRLPLLLGLLKGIDESKWEDIQIVHYGY